MIDPASISAALGSAKTMLDFAKGANDAHLAMKISAEVANLQGRLIDVQQQALALQKENHDLNDEIRTLKRRRCQKPVTRNHAQNFGKRPGCGIERKRLNLWGPGRDAKGLRMLILSVHRKQNR
jgi:hypothetical protein